MTEVKYYYNQLNRIQKQTYHEMREGLEAVASSFSLPRLSDEELTQIFFFLRLDCPYLFYIARFTYRYYTEADSIEFIPEYLFNKAKVLDHKAAMTARIRKLVQPVGSLSDMEKLLYIHDFICTNVRYDKLKKAYSHEIIGPLGQGVGVCEGIAKTFKLLCDELNLWCIVAIADSNPGKGIRYRHAWNIVELDGKYYHIDATFDNSLGQNGVLRYDYFLQNDQQMFRDHEPVIWPIPGCTDGNHTYYREKKLSFTTCEEVKKRAAQAARKNKTLVFHWRGGYLTRDVLNEILRIVEAEGNAKGKHPLLSVNWPQAVLQLEYKTQKPSAQIVTEKANEGEQ